MKKRFTEKKQNKKPEINSNSFGDRRKIEKKNTIFFSRKICERVRHGRRVRVASVRARTARTRIHYSFIEQNTHTCSHSRSHTRSVLHTTRTHTFTHSTLIPLENARTQTRPVPLTV